MINFNVGNLKCRYAKKDNIAFVYPKNGKGVVITLYPKESGNLFSKLHYVMYTAVKIGEMNG